MRTSAAGGGPNATSETGRPAPAGRPGPVLSVGLFLLFLSGAARTARAQADGPHPRDLSSLGVDTASLATGPYASMEGLLERTILQVNVATAEVRVGPSTAVRLAELVNGGIRDGALRDSLARTAMEATDALVRIRFHRYVELGRFLAELRKDLRRAREAEIVSPVEYDSVSASLPRWYSFLEDRGVRDGDEMIYRIRGDTLRTVYVTRDGEVALDQVDVGSFRRLAVLGGYLAPGASFRKPLLRSLLDEE